MNRLEQQLAHIREKLNLYVYVTPHEQDPELMQFYYQTESGKIASTEFVNESTGLILLENILLNNKIRLKRLNVEIPLYLHSRLKEECDKRNITMRQALEEMTRNYIND